MSEKEKLDVLHRILSGIVDWLKFAEAKNGVIVGGGGALLFGVYNLLGHEDATYFEISYLASFMVLMAASILISLLSFVPRLAPPFWIKMGEKTTNDNPIYFGDACKYSRQTYLALFNERYKWEDAGGIRLLEEDLCHQIVVNARIAFIKYKMFNSALWLFIAAATTPIGAWLIFRVKD